MAKYDYFSNIRIALYTSSSLSSRSQDFWIASPLLVLVIEFRPISGELARG